MKIKILKQIGKHTPGDIVNVECDKSGVPLHSFWRRRLRDAKIDGCCEVVQPEPETKPQPEIDKPAKSKQSRKYERSKI